MDLHISLVGRTKLSAEIYQQVRQAIVDGRIIAGDALPPTRVLAERLGVARATVTTAYERLAGEGFVASRVGAGTFVDPRAGRSRRAAKRRPGGALQPRAVWDSIRVTDAFDRPARFDFRTGLPAASLFPHDTWRRLSARAMRSDSVRSGVYAHPAGHVALREAIARHIAVARSVDASADDITITSGTQQALDVIARVLLTRGDVVAVEDPGYSPPRLLFRSLGLRVVGVPVDSEGLVVAALPARARLVYVTPSHHYPLGMPMSLQRRMQLLEWAERNHAAIIEDDYDSEFRFGGRPIEPMQTLDPAGRVVYVGSFSKSLLPTLRLGFLLTPPSLTPAVHKAKYVTDWHTSMLAQATLASFIDEGEFARHVRRALRVYAARHAEIVATLAEDFADYFEVIPSASGLHIAAVARFAKHDRLADVARRAADVGVQVQLVSRFAVGRRKYSGLVLGFGAIERSRIKEGLRLLKTCIRDAERAERRSRPPR